MLASIWLLHTSKNKEWSRGSLRSVGGHSKTTTYNQEIGTPFSWGLQPYYSWSKQIVRLLAGTRLTHAMLYTVVPGVAGAVEYLGETALRVLVPFDRHYLAPLVLVVEHVMLPPMVRRAIHCTEPCTVRTVFQIVGLLHWCNAFHTCTVTFTNGRCRNDFHDDDRILLPTASLVRLSVQNVLTEVCEGSTPADRLLSLSRHVADQLHREVQVSIGVLSGRFRKSFCTPMNLT